MKKRKWLLAALAVALVLSAGIGSAWAYFTTYAAAEGGLVLDLGSRAELYEGFQSWTKEFQVLNKADSKEPIYVRAQYYGPEEYYVGVTPDRQAVSLSYEVTGEGWIDGGDGYWYYTQAVAPGERTGVLNVKINGARLSGDATPPEDGESFNVVIVYETVAVTYTESGEPVGAQGADWSGVLDTGRTEEEVEP